MINKDEGKRRKAFAKRARKIIAVWPGYAKALPDPETVTDMAMQADLQASQAALVDGWAGARAGKLTMEQFDALVMRWWIDRLHAIEMDYNKGER